jgi:hypothetical protein
MSQLFYLILNLANPSFYYHNVSPGAYAIKKKKIFNLEQYLIYFNTPICFKKYVETVQRRSYKREYVTCQKEQLPSVGRVLPPCSVKNPDMIRFKTADGNVVAKPFQSASLWLEIWAKLGPGE